MSPVVTTYLHAVQFQLEVAESTHPPRTFEVGDTLIERKTLRAIRICK